MQNREIDHGRAFDFGKTSKDYARFRDIYPAALYARLRVLGVGRAGSRWLDLGTGPGVLPRNLADCGAGIIGIDISADQIREAIALSADFPNITYRVCPAERTGLPDGSLDSITACQCFWYFDPQTLVSEIRRLLVPGGRFIKILMSWSPDDPVAGASEQLVRRLNPEWTSDDLALRDMRTHLFDHPEEESFTADLPFTRESWHGRMLTCRGVQGSMAPSALARFQQEHLRLLAAFPECFTVTHRVDIVSYRVD